MANVIVNKRMSASASASVSMGVSCEYGCSEFMVIHTEEAEEEDEEWSPQVGSQLVMIAKLSVSLWVESAARSAIFG